MIYELRKYLLKGILIGVALLILGSLGLIMISSYVVEETRGQIYTIDDIDSFDADCILILGAGVWENNTPSPMLKDRLDKGIELSLNGVEETLLMSGDHGTINYDEVNVMKEYAISAGLLSSDVFMDHAGFSTYESVYRAKYIFGVKKVIIVSQKEHLYRALYLANALGLEAIGVAAETKSYGGQLYRDIRETLARFKDVFTAFLKPAPTALGDFIPIDGNGDVTNDR